MSIFDAYDQEYTALSRDITKNIVDLKKLNSESANSVSSIRHCDALINQAVDLIKQMEIEVRSQEPTTRKNLNEKLTAYKKALSSLKLDCEHAKEQATRSALIGDKSSEQRQRLLTVNNKYEMKQI